MKKGKMESIRMNLSKIIWLQVSAGCILLAAMLPVKSMAQNERKERKLQLTGTIKGLPDNSMVLLLDVAGRIERKAVVRNNSFKFIMDNQVGVDRFFFAIAPESNPANVSECLWLDEGNVTLTVDSKDVKTLKLTGSKPHDEYLALTSRWKRGYQPDVKELSRLMAANPGSPIIPYFVWKYGKDFKVEDLRKLYEIINKEAKGFAYSMRLLAWIKLKEQHPLFFSANKKGAIMPDYFLLSDEGASTNIDASSFQRTKLTLFHFWTAASSSSSRNFQELNEVYRNMKDRGFELLSISLDSSFFTWKEALTKMKVPGVQFSDVYSRALIPLFSDIQPSSYYLLDSTGRILFAQEDLAGKGRGKTDAPFVGNGNRLNQIVDSILTARNYTAAPIVQRNHKNVK